MTELAIPLGLMPALALPPPSSFDLIDGSVRNFADWRSGGALLHGVPDPQVKPDQWVLHYRNVPGSVANAIRAHFRDHGNGTWLWIYPRTTTQIPVIYLQPSSISWRHRRVADATVYLERALAL